MNKQVVDNSNLDDKYCEFIVEKINNNNKLSAMNSVNYIFRIIDTKFKEQILLQ